MTAYAAIFLLDENLPAVLPKRWFECIKAALWVHGLRGVPAASHAPVVPRLADGDRRYESPSSLADPDASRFYLMQAIVCGFASLIIILIVACLAWKRPLDVPILATLAKFMAWSSIVFVVVRYADVVIRGQLGLAFTADWYAVLFHGENLFVLVPALVLLNERLRHIPRVLFLGATATAIGGLVYRFSPTTLAFRYGRSSIYFPSTEELLMCVGYIGLTVALFILFILVVRRFAILPDRLPD